MRQSTAVVYFAVDPFFPIGGKPEAGLEGFLEELERFGMPVVLVSDRSRMQLDAPRRQLGHAHPFIAEGGGGVFLPEDYFHLRVERSVRLGRFVCLPVAEPQPSAAHTLENLSKDTEVTVVALRALSPRELAQNTGLPAREADLVRQRDFEELFFFAGADEEAIRRFQEEALRRKLVLREAPPLWSLSVGADSGRAAQQLGRLYDRAMHAHAPTVGIEAAGTTGRFMNACDRRVALTRRSAELGFEVAHSGRNVAFQLRSPADWAGLVRLLTLRA